MLPKEGNDLLNEINPFPYAVPMHMFLVIVVASIDIDVANLEELRERVKTVKAFFALCHRELMGHLETSFVPSSIVSMRLTNEVDRETTFSIDETGNPSDFDQSFLLIVRIRRIFTARFANTL